MLLGHKLIFTYLFAALSLTLAFGIVGFLSVRQTTNLHVSEISEVALDAMAAEIKLEVKARVDAVQSVLLSELGRRQGTDPTRDVFAAASKRHPHDPRMYLYLGHAYAGLGEPDRAAELYATAVALAGPRGRSLLNSTERQEVIQAAEAAQKKLKGSS